MDDAFVKSPSEVLKSFGVSESRGLSGAKVKEQRSKFGPNCMCNQAGKRGVGILDVH